MIFDENDPNVEPWFKSVDDCYLIVKTGVNNLDYELQLNFQGVRVWGT